MPSKKATTEPKACKAVVESADLQTHPKFRWVCSCGAHGEYWDQKSEAESWGRSHERGHDKPTGPVNYRRGA